MRFSKADPAQSRLKTSIYGPPGSGKTFTTLLFAEGLASKTGGRVAYVDTERGTDFYVQSVKERKAHPDAFDIDAIYTRSLADVLEAVKALDPKEHSVVVLDSVSHLWEAAIDAYDGKKVGKDNDKIPMHAWGAIKRPYKELISHLIGSEHHVFILGRQKNVFEDDDGEVRAAGVAMRAEGETQYEPHVCLRMESRDGKVRMHVEKDRTGVLQGRMFQNPKFDAIVPLLALLGDHQAPAEDEEERHAKDSELHERQAAKEKAKEAKSSNILAEFAARVGAASTVEELGEMAAEVKKLRRNVTAPHRETLQSLFSARARQLTDAAIEEVA